MDNLVKAGSSFERAGDYHIEHASEHHVAYETYIDGQHLCEMNANKVEECAHEEVLSAHLSNKTSTVCWQREDGPQDDPEACAAERFEGRLEQRLLSIGLSELIDSPSSPIPSLPSSPKLNDDIERFPSMSPASKICQTPDVEAVSPRDYEAGLGRQTLQDLEMNTWQRSKLSSALMEASESSNYFVSEGFSDQWCGSSICAETSDYYSGHCQSSMLSSEIDSLPAPLAPDLYDAAGNSLTGQRNIRFDEMYGMFRANSRHLGTPVPTKAPSKVVRKRNRAEVGDSIVLPGPAYTKLSKSNQGMFMTFRVNKLQGLKRSEK